MANGKVIKFGESAQEKIIEGVELAANAIARTLGPAGRGVSLGLDFGAPEITRDGASVAKFITFSDPMLNQGAQLVKKAASLTEDSAGDGTSSCSILTKELCKKGQRAIKTGANVNEIKSGMLKAQKWMTQYIAQNATKVDGDLELIRKVATISANNDPEVGNLVVECMNKVGINGVLTADMASGLETVIDVTTGMKLDRGWASPQYITNPEDGQCIMEEPYILVASERISSVAQLMNLLQDFQTNSAGRPLLIVCDDMDETVNAMFVFNTLRAASLTTAYASGNKSSNVSPSANRFLNSSVFPLSSSSVNSIIAGLRATIFFTIGFMRLISLSLCVPITFVIRLIVNLLIFFILCLTTNFIQF